jgi:DNA-binding IclR family transcriptional regulator
MARAAKAESGGLVKVERLQEVLDLLREAGAKGLTKAQLAKKLGSSERTVARALDLLADQGASLAEQRLRSGVKVWVLEAGPRWDERVSPEARLALQVALLALAGGGTEVWTQHLRGL